MTSNTNKLEITITSTKKNLDQQKLTLYFRSRGCGEIKKCKVLPDHNKAFITFKDSASYDAALELMPCAFEILPSNINLNHIYRDQQRIKKKLSRVEVGITKILAEMDRSFQILEDEVTTCMLSISDDIKWSIEDISELKTNSDRFHSKKMGSDVASIAEELKEFKLTTKEATENSRIFKDEKSSSYDEETQSNEDAASSYDEEAFKVECAKFQKGFNDYIMKIRKDRKV